MNTKRLSIVAIALVGFLLIAGMATAVPGFSLAASPTPAAITSTTNAVPSEISYQGRLTDASGSPLNGTYAMRFIIYNDPVAGSALSDTGNINVTVDNGLFEVGIGVNQAIVNGQPLWLNIIIGGESLSPRQEILPAPYALSLRPGAQINGDAIAASDAALSSYTPATGTAMFAEASGGTGVEAHSTFNYAVRGSSTLSWGGYFTSQNGYGLRVDTQGTDHYDHGAFITSQGGYAVYAQSASNMGVRAEAGDITGIPKPLGPIGVVGLGQNRGVVGSSDSGMGMYASSVTNYGVWGQSTEYRGVTGRTGRSDDNYGFYTPDNLFAKNYTVLNSIMLVMQNNSDAPLSPGDVVVFSGINRNAAIDAPVVQVSKATRANSTAVAGVVFSRFNIDAVNPDLEPDDLAALSADLEVTPAGDAAPGEYVLVVVQGPAEVNVDALDASIQPGDLLATQGAAGMAGKAATMSIDGVKTTAPGAVFGKALEAVDGSRKKIYVFVTLQ
ncbi:MAG: hypothetical protein DSY55_06495 [Clostridia bacterium]|nr:MAG: hypothetical protein DSY55_06495 [Clostridia bacterium]